MPNFAHFEARINGSAWTAVDPVVFWTLAEGANSLQVRATDSFANHGPSTTVRVRRGPAPGAADPERQVGGSWRPVTILPVL